MAHIILSSPLDCDYTETLYRRRWTLETVYRGLKSTGFNIAETHMNAVRFENMLTLSMPAFAAEFIEGLLKIESLPIPLIRKKKRTAYEHFPIWLRQSVL